MLDCDVDSLKSDGDCNIDVDWRPLLPPLGDTIGVCCGPKLLLLRPLLVLLLLPVARHIVVTCKSIIELTAFCSVAISMKSSPHCDERRSGD